MLEGCGSDGWAFETHREALALAPRHLPAHEGLVRAAIATGQAAAAEETLRRLKDGAAPVEAGIGLALLYNSLGRPAEALQSLQEAIRADPRNVKALLLAAEIQRSLGNLEAVEALAGGALEASPGDPDAEALLAAASLARGLPKEAAVRAEAVLARHPAAPRALEVAAIARAMAGEREDARRLFARLVAAEPRDSGHLNNFGVFELEGGDAAAAARLFEQAVDVDPDDKAGYLGLRQAAQALDDAARLARAERGLERLGAR
jgi:Tfp pilus assembly protein PilF